MFFFPQGKQDPVPFFNELLSQVFEEMNMCRVAYVE
jgi:hypothetical protein